MNKTPQCALGRVIESGINAEEVKRNGWRLHGILVVRVDDDRLDTIQQAAVLSIGHTLYGKRKAANDTGSAL